MATTVMRLRHSTTSLSPHLVVAISTLSFAALRQALRLCGTPAVAPHRLFKS